jgi:hypothetical protein
MPDPLTEVYEKFKYLDGCLSDTAWCNAGGSAIYGIAGEMWRAIKETCEKHRTKEGRHSMTRLLR